MSQLAVLLTYLLSLGPKLPGLVESLQIIMGELQKIADTFSSGVGAEAVPVVLSPEEARLKSEVIALASNEGVSGPIDRLLSFLETHPQLVALLLSLLKLKQ